MVSFFFFVFLHFFLVFFFFFNFFSYPKYVSKDLYRSQGLAPAIFFDRKPLARTNWW